MGDFADRMHAEHIDHLEEIIRLLTEENTALRALAPFVDHRPGCIHPLGIGSGHCSCGCRQAALEAPPDTFPSTRYHYLTVPRPLKKPDPWMRRHV